MGRITRRYTLSMSLLNALNESVEPHYGMSLPTA